MEDTLRGGAPALHRRGREAEAAPHQRVSRLQVQAEEEGQGHHANGRGQDCETRDGPHPAAHQTSAAAAAVQQPQGGPVGGQKVFINHHHHLLRQKNDELKMRPFSPAEVGTERRGLPPADDHIVLLLSVVPASVRRGAAQPDLLLLLVRLIVGGLPGLATGRELLVTGLTRPPPPRGRAPPRPDGQPPAPDIQGGGGGGGDGGDV